MIGFKGWAGAFFTGALLTVGMVGGAQAGPGGALPADARYPYNGPQFQKWVQDSYRLAPNGGKGIASFTTVFEGRARKFGAPKGISAYLAAQKASIASAPNAQERTRRQLVLAQNLHRIIKKSIPKFSLDRGFEFASVARTGERQCLLQSVILSSMLQKAGVPAGTAMVWKGEEPDPSNLGHVVAVMRTASGKDALVDCSDMHPFARHGGLYLPEAGTGKYRFVAPQYTAAPPAPNQLPTTPPTVAGTPLVTGYARMDGKGVLKDAQVRPLSIAYLTSQFDYYRGERVPGGVMSGAKPTPEALQQTVQFWGRSVKECPDNPLATLQLARAEARLGQTAQSTAGMQAAYRLYKNAGFIPPTATEMIAMDKRPVPAQARQGKPTLPNAGR